MHPKAVKLLNDIRDCALFVRDVASGKTIDDYRNDRILRQAIERNFEIIGEAISRLEKVAPDVAQTIEHARQIIGFRNVLAHGYDLVDDETVWKTIQHDIPELIRQVQGRLERGST